MEQPWLQVLIKASGAGSMPIVRNTCRRNFIVYAACWVDRPGEPSLLRTFFVPAERTPELNLSGILSLY